MNEIFFLGIFGINFLLIIFYENISKLINIFDKPDKIRKKHSTPVPLLTFLFIFLCFAWLIIFILYEYNLIYLYSILKIETNKQFLILVLSILSITLVGLFDDKFKISVSIKIICLTLILYLNINIDTGLRIYEIYSIYFSKVFLINNSSIILTIFCIFALINAMNMFDGTNIQVVFYFLLIFLYFIIKGMFTELSLTMLVPLFFILYLNIKNKIFLGDSGIYLITYIISYVLIKSNNFINKIAAEEIFFIFLIPALDMIRLFSYRLSKNLNPFIADTNHIHHILLRKIKFTNYILLIVSLIFSKFFIIFFFKEYLFNFYFLIIFTYFYLLIKFR